MWKTLPSSIYADDATWIMCFDKRQYVISQSLDQITQSVSSLQFFRLNRQYSY